MTTGVPASVTSPSARIGGGSGFSGDRVEPALDLVRRGDLSDLVLECLAERTIALGQQRRLGDPAAGFDPHLERRLSALLPEALARGVRIITNMGAANPLAAGHAVVDLANRLGVAARVAVVTGDDVLDRLDLDQPSLEDGRPLRSYGKILSANAYLGADSILPALTAGADVVITGRVADPSLFLAPLVHRLGWGLEDWQAMAAGTLVGHLLECAAQVTGGYFAEPGRKDVPDLAHLGFPFAEVTRDGVATIGKLAGTGGRVDRATVREQLFYEVTDPGDYVTPDVRLDLTAVTASSTAPDRVTVAGATGRARPDQLKVSVGYQAGHRGEAEISYVGPNAEARARLAGQVVSERLTGLGAEVRLDLIGSVPLLPAAELDQRDHECRLRVAVLGDRETADRICQEVEALYTNGPAGGGGVRTRVTEVVGIVSGFIHRERVIPDVSVLRSDSHAAV